MTDRGIAVDLEIVPRDQYKVTVQTRMASANDLRISQTSPSWTSPPG